jgi:hypothetical protein
LYRHTGTISGGMHEFAFPPSVSDEFGFDLFQWLRELRAQKIVANLAYDFLFPPTIETLGAAVPKIYSTVHRASHNAIVKTLKKIFILLQ